MSNAGSKKKISSETVSLVVDDITISSFRDELSSMEHPFFALQSGDTTVRVYENQDVTITVRPAVGIGMATIFDKDVWIYALSKLQKAVNEGGDCSRVIAFTGYDYLKSTNRSVGGKSYKDLERSLERLLGTSIKTNIVRSDGAIDEEGFNLIERYRSVTHPSKPGTSLFEVTLPDWLYSSIVSHKKVLRISPDYFGIRKAIDRRIYEIARKFCGNKDSASISLDKLKLRVGSLVPMSKFRAQVRAIEAANQMPDYAISHNSDSDIVTFELRKEPRPVPEKKVRKKRSPNTVDEVDGETPKGFRG